MTGSSFSTCCHSNDFLLPVASKLSRYCRAVSKRLRVTSATTSESLILNVAVSTAKGLPYLRDQLLANPARAVADHALGVLAQDAPGRG